MSTLTVGLLINDAVSSMPSGQAYLNIGVWHGFSFFSGMIGNPGAICIGVDNFSSFGKPREEFMQCFNRFKSPNHRFYEMGYTQYLRSVHKGKIGVYAYDGNHAYINQLLALELAEPFFVPGTIIIIDDMNWETPSQATAEFLRSRPNQYQTLLDARTAQNIHPTYWNGIVVLQKK